MLDTKFRHKLEFFGQRVQEIWPFKVALLPKNSHISLFWVPCQNQPKFFGSSIGYGLPRGSSTKNTGIQDLPKMPPYSKNEKNDQKMTKKYPKMTIFLHFFNFFIKLIILSSPKLPCINISFVQTYSQSYSVSQSQSRRASD